MLAQTYKLSNLLSRDDLNVPSETFVLKSVMQRVKHKKDEMMAVAAKSLERFVWGWWISGLNTDEIQREPEIHIWVYETSVFKQMLSYNSKFAVEISKRGYMCPVRENTLNTFLNVLSVKRLWLKSHRRFSGVGRKTGREGWKKPARFTGRVNCFERQFCIFGFSNRWLLRVEEGINIIC